MAKQSLQQINQLNKFLTKETLLPIYFLCGEDSYTIEHAVEDIEKVVSPLLGSDFDREVFAADKSTELNQILDLALSFPFGGEKRLLVIKNFEKFNDKKTLCSYVKDPPSFSVLIITQMGAVSNISSEPYNLLISKGFLFEAKPISGNELVDWFIRIAKKRGLDLPANHAGAVIEVVGENKALLEMQIQKFLDYSNSGKKLTVDELIKLSSPTKEYSIFDFQAVLGQGNKTKSLEIGLNLLNSGVDIVLIINMVAKFIMTVAQVFDLNKQGITDKFTAGKLAGANPFYYSNCQKATYFLSEAKLHNAAKALLNADLSVKGSGIDHKTILQILIAELLGEVAVSHFQY
ncbi:MAG: DNA polymerase III delta subunit [Ignavibacteria bacterium]|nr:MAG: DNA polymerase III delta subunit [Ignavibacteria bacterium]KAF0161469.1 MAG: DNA polymerase III delta subunit [Ignavibacteria bacterium]